MKYTFIWKFVDYPNETVKDTYFCRDSAELFEIFIDWAKDYIPTIGDRITIKETATDKIIKEILL